MSRAGWFDANGIPLGWFDVTGQSSGWFDVTNLDPPTGSAVNYTLSGAAGNYTYTGQEGTFTVHSGFQMDMHDGGFTTRHKEPERDYAEEYRQAQLALRKSITDAFEQITGEPRIPDARDVAHVEATIKRFPRAQRPQVQSALKKINTWQIEHEALQKQLDQMYQDDEEDVLLLMQ